MSPLDKISGGELAQTLDLFPDRGLQLVE